LVTVRGLVDQVVETIRQGQVLALLTKVMLVVLGVGLLTTTLQVVVAEQERLVQCTT
jgi:hypothetical protein